MVDTIEQNVEQVTINVDHGNRQLEKGVMYKVREREREGGRGREGGREGGREREREREREPAVQFTS